MSFANKKEIVITVTGSMIAAHLIIGEVPTDSGNQLLFNLANSIVATSLDVFRNGILQKQGVDYTVVSGASSFTLTGGGALAGGETLLVDYIKP